MLNDEQHHKLLGFAKSQIKEQKRERKKHTKGKFEAILDRDSDNDFTEDGSTMTKSQVPTNDQ